MEKQTKECENKKNKEEFHTHCAISRLAQMLIVI